MYAGRVVESGTVEEVLLSPKHPYTQGLLGSMPAVKKRGQPLNAIKGAVPNPSACRRAASSRHAATTPGSAARRNPS